MPIACAFRKDSKFMRVLSHCPITEQREAAALLFLSSVHHSSTFVIIKHTSIQPTKEIKDKEPGCHAEDRTPSPHIQIACAST
jgi:hypothetical protein